VAIAATSAPALADAALRAAYARVLVPPPPAGPGACRTCCAPVPAPAVLCRSCRRLPAVLDAVLPASLSVGGGRLYRELRGYKDDAAEAARDAYTRGLALVLAMFLSAHERCLASAAGVSAFTVVTTVPSGRGRDTAARWRLSAIVGELCAPTAARFRRLLAPAASDGAAARGWRPDRYRALEVLGGADVLLVDDTWTSGASAQAAALALRRGGAGAVALVVLGRYVDAAEAATARWLRAAPAFVWQSCALAGRCRAGASRR
jgi:predicted amidophosphoribosyltransferase